jgi:hypothetical protein
MATKDKAPKPEEDRSILINFVLDKSGSMDVIRQATISGFNEFKNDQTHEEGDAFFTLTLFDTRFDTVAAAVPVREVPDLDYATYAPGGMTALYDAIGHTIRLTDDFVAANKPDQVMFVIMTDGGENSSREFSHRQIFDLIRDRQENAEYEFIFLGANQDSYAVTQDMGMHAGRSVDFDASAEGSAMAMKRASRNVSAHRRQGAKMRDDFFSAELEGLGAIDPEVWKGMTPEERKRHLDEGRGAGA